MAITRTFSNSTTAFKKSDIDKDNGVLRNVVIAEQGINKNGSLFDRKFLQKLVVLGNEQQQGVKSRFGHPNMCSESLGTYLGRFKEFQLKNKKVLANLYLDEIAKKAPNGDLYTYVLEHAERNPDMFGNSIVVGYKEEDLEIKTVTNSDGEEVEVEYFIPSSLPSSDIVDDPAATGALFSSENLGVQISEFLDTITEDQKTSLFKTIQSSKKVKEFINRYSSNMGIFEKAFGAKKGDAPEGGGTPEFRFSQENYNSILEENKELRKELEELKSNFSSENLFSVIKESVSNLVRNDLETFSKGVESQLAESLNERLEEFAKNTKSEFQAIATNKGFTDSKPSGFDFSGVTVNKEGK